MPSKKALRKYHANKDHNIVDHLRLPKPDYEERYGKLPSNWNRMTHKQKMNHVDKKNIMNDAKRDGMPKGKN